MLIVAVVWARCYTELDRRAWWRPCTRTSWLQSSKRNLAPGFRHRDRWLSAPSVQQKECVDILGCPAVACQGGEFGDLYSVFGAFVGAMTIVYVNHFDEMLL